jgi:CCR4-NOT transcription complex subunit 9
LYLYPFLGTSYPEDEYEHLRLSSLGVVGALVKSEDPDVIKFLLSTEIIPLSLRIMENGTEISQFVATFILQKIVKI